jgi:pentatricopeptide repeat protein
MDGISDRSLWSCSQMQLANIKPDVVTYTALINAYSKSRRVEEAQGVFQEMVASGLR